jgi:Transcriptional activator of glycolytic enzymes
LEFRERLSATQDPESLLIQQAFPVVAESINNLAALTGQNQLSLNDLDVKLRELQQLVANMQSASTASTSNLHTSIMSGLHAFASTFSPSAALHLPETTIPIISSNSSPTTGLITESTSTFSISLPEVPRCNISYYTMNRDIDTVKEAWAEYAIGLVGSDGTKFPSITAMNEVHKSKWRESGKDSKFYCRRKPLWDAIETILEQVYPTGNYDDNDTLLILKGLDLLRRFHFKSLSKVCLQFANDFKSVDYDKKNFFVLFKREYSAKVKILLERELNCMGWPVGN